MPFLGFCSVAVFVSIVAAAPINLSAQTPADDIPSAFLGKTITPGVGIAYAGDTPHQKFENTPSGYPVKTYVYQDGHEKFYIEDGIMKGFMHMEAEFPKYFRPGTEFKVTNVLLGKSDVTIVFAPVEGSNIGTVKLMLGSGYNAKPAAEVVSQISKMLILGVSTGPKKTAVAAPPVTLDCAPIEAVTNAQLREVVLDEANQVATFQIVGQPKPMQPAVFSDAQIEWNNGTPGNARQFYRLSRSSGQLVLKGAVSYYQGGSVLGPVTYACTIRAKKF